MLELTRSVRFCINPDDQPWGPAHNTFAAYPSMRGLGRFYELDATCRGEIDARTGYFLNIKQIDQAVRAGAVPIIERACREAPAGEPALLLPVIMDDLSARLAGSLRSVRWRLTPYHSVEMTAADRNTVLLRQQFEFAASHRLHCRDLSDSENRAIFGKCNNPSGHGHNYRVEPCVEVRLVPAGQAGAGPRFSLVDLERLTNQVIIERYDHKHLNSDVAEFSPEGLGNPSVENIARACFDRLAPAVADAAPDGSARLRSITVWETDKTSCTYPA